MRKLIFTSLLLFAIMSNLLAQLKDPPEMNAFIEKLISQMTIEEKLGQITQYDFGGIAANNPMRATYDKWMRESRIGSFLNIWGAEETRKIQRIAVEKSRLKIPVLIGHDVIHGWRTTFPIPLAEAASWDIAAVEKAARIAAIEATAEGVPWTFAPMVDIARDPRWGRIAEGSGEDSYLGSLMAAARVRGFQGTDLRLPNTMLACVKHYAAYGGAEAGRDYNIAEMSENTLREIYLPPYRAAVNAGAATLMASFNEINGVPVHASRRMLTDILRGEWKFDGMVVSDYTGIMELLLHGIAADSVEAAQLALNAGVDLEMVSGFYSKFLKEALAKGLVNVAVIDEAVRRVLVAKYRLGLFDDPYRYNNAQREKTEILTPEHRAVSRDMARKSIVLLKNENNLLPLAKKVKKLAVIGALADDSDAPLGPWRAMGNKKDVVTVLAGIKKAMADPSAVHFEAAYNTTDFKLVGLDKAVKTAGEADVVVAVVGERAFMSGEAASRSDIGLPGEQQLLLEALKKTGKPVVVLLMNGRPLAISWIEDHIPAILEGWFLGVEMGNAFSDILFGDANPSGRLPVTFPRTTGQVPIYYNHKNTGRPGNDLVQYSSRYIDIPVTPLYPFGYGLSYTSFSIGEPALDKTQLKSSDSLYVTVKVRNTGNRDGVETVQIYVQDIAGSMTRPVKELKRFKQVSLKAGEEQTLRFALGFDDMAFYNQSMQRVVEPGKFRVFAGANSADVKPASFEVVR